MKHVRAVLMLGCAAAVGACVPKRETPPPAPQQPRPTPRPAPAPPPPPPAPADWRDMPLTPGDWTYSSQGGTSQALFGPGGGARFIVRCDRERREVSLWREGRTAGTMMTVRTSYGARSLPVSLQSEPAASVQASLPAGDRTLDQIAFSRGRFTIEVPGLPMLVIPAWAEPARVVEDCRG